MSYTQGNCTVRKVEHPLIIIHGIPQSAHAILLVQTGCPDTLQHRQTGQQDNSHDLSQ